MLMNDKIIFDRYYLHKFCETNNGALYITASSHLYARKGFHSYACSGRISVNYLSTCFAWRPLTSINKSHVLTARAHENCVNNTWLFYHKYMAVDIVWHGYLCNNKA